VADAAENVHGTAIALGASAVLIRGAPGSGKSDLALRCLAMAPTALIPSPTMLIADDRVELKRAQGRLTASAPASIRGRIEVRGLGIVTVPYAASATLALIADLVDSDRIERLPDPAPQTEILGVQLPLLRIAPFEAAAPVKLLLALAQSLRNA
jgi:serine kinase of HPr protein (carbohydrate metabolism regulator)